MLSATHSSRFVPSLMGPMPELMGPVPQLMGPMPQLMGLGEAQWPARALALGAGVAAVATALSSVMAPQHFGKAAAATTALGSVTLGLALLNLMSAKEELVVPTSRLNMASLEVITGGIALATVAINALVRR